MNLRTINQQSGLFIVLFVIFFLYSSAFAMKPGLSSLLEQKSIKNLAASTAIFHQSGGDATQIEQVSLTYFTSNDCTTGPFLPAFTTPNSSPALTIPNSGNILLNALSTY